MRSAIRVVGDAQLGAGMGSFSRSMTRLPGDCSACNASRLLLDGRISVRGRVITARTAARQVCHGTQRALERRSPRSVLMVFIVMRESTRAMAGSPISWVVSQCS